MHHSFFFSLGGKGSGGSHTFLNRYDSQINHSQINHSFVLLASFFTNADTTGLQQLQLVLSMTFLI